MTEPRLAIVIVPFSPSERAMVPVPVLPLTVSPMVAVPLETTDAGDSVVLTVPIPSALSVLVPNAGLPSCVVRKTTHPLVTLRVSGSVIE